MVKSSRSVEPPRTVGPVGVIAPTAAGLVGTPGAGTGCRRITTTVRSSTAWVGTRSIRCSASPDQSLRAANCSTLS
jgi:hypothetical protein